MVGSRRIEMSSVALGCSSRANQNLFQSGTDKHNENTRKSEDTPGRRNTCESGHR